MLGVCLSISHNSGLVPQNEYWLETPRLKKPSLPPISQLSPDVTARDKISVKVSIVTEL